MDALELAKSALALFAIVDPIGTIPLFLAATHGFADAQRKLAARVTAVTVFGVLAVYTPCWVSRCWFFFGIRLA